MCRLDLEIENFPTKIFKWRKYHPKFDHKIKSGMRISSKKQDKNKEDQEEKGEKIFPPSYTQVNEGEIQIYKYKSP